MKKIGIVGMGYVGKAFYEFIKNHFEIITFDIKDNIEYPKKDIDSCDLVVVCVPTP